MKKVLLINDCKFEKMIIKDLLTQLGYDVQLSDEYEALRIIETYLPNIVIANLIMKEITGDKLIKKIKSINKNIKCILSSSNDLNIDSYKEIGVDDVIQTPINKEKLIKVLMDKRHIDIKFCPYCGENLSELHSGIVFCPFCGQRL